MTATRCPTTRWCSPPARGTPISAMTNGSRSRPGLKTLEDATTLRRRILVAFERAERETDPATARGAADLRHHRRRPDRRRTGRHHRRTGAGHAAAGLPQHRHPQGARRADRGRPARAGRLSPTTSRPMRSARWRSSASRWCWDSRSPNARADGVVYGGKQLRGQDHHLGRRRARLAARPNGSARRPTAPAACRSSPISPCPAIPISSRSATP